MDKFGDSFRHIHTKFNSKFSLKTTVQIGIQLIKIMQQIHEYGFVFNDLKPDNILLGEQSLLYFFNNFR